MSKSNARAITEIRCQSSKVDEIIVDPVTSAVYHIEKRPSEGRNVLVNTEEGRDVVGQGFNCRTAVQEVSTRIRPLLAATER